MYREKPLHEDIDDIIMLTNYDYGTKYDMFVL